MATVLRQHGFVVRVYGPPREHPPPHVHVERGGEVVVIRLGTGEDPPMVWAVYGMRDRDVVRAFRLVERHLEQIRYSWRAIHGSADQ